MPVGERTRFTRTHRHQPLPLCQQPCTLCSLNSHDVLRCHFVERQKGKFILKCFWRGVGTPSDLLLKEGNPPVLCGLEEQRCSSAFLPPCLVQGEFPVFSTGRQEGENILPPLGPSQQPLSFVACAETTEKERVTFTESGEDVGGQDCKRQLFWSPLHKRSRPPCYQVLQPTRARSLAQLT